MSKQRIRFLNTYEPVSRHYRDLFPVLIARGWQVEVVISKAQYRAGRDTDWMIPGVQVRWVPSFGLQATSKRNKLLIMLAYLFFAPLLTLFGRGVALNVFLTQPPLFLLWGWVLRIVRRQPYIQSVMDLYPEMAIALGALPAGSALTRLLSGIAHFSMKRADGLIAIGRGMRQRLLDMGAAAERVQYIPSSSWANTEAIQPLEHADNPFRDAHGWQGKFVLMFAGNIGIPQYFDDLLEVCRRLKDEPTFVMAFVGDGVRVKDLQAHQAAHGLTNIAFIPYQPPAQQSYFLSAGDAHFVSLRNGIEGLAVPSKSYSIMAAGRPIIYQGHPSGEIARMVSDYGIGFSLPVGAVDELEAAIRQYVTNPQLARAQGQRARQFAENEHNASTICARLADLMDAFARQRATAGTEGDYA